MARRILQLLLGVLTVSILAAPASAQTQRFLFFGGGATIPSGDYGDYANAGWMVDAGVGTTIGDKGLWAAIALQYGSNSHEADGDKTNLTLGSILLGYTFNPEAKFSPYVFGGVGMMNHAYKSESSPSAEGSESFVAISGGVGVIMRRNERTSFFAHTGYTTGSKDGFSTSFIPVKVGMSINLAPRQ